MEVKELKELVKHSATVFNKKIEDTVIHPLSIPYANIEQKEGRIMREDTKNYTYLSKNIINVLKKCGFTKIEEDLQDEFDLFIYVYQKTPNGREWQQIFVVEDFIKDKQIDDVVFYKEVCKTSDNFNVDEEIQPIIANADYHFKNSKDLPIRKLLEDGEWEKEKLKELKNTLYKELNKNKNNSL